MLNRDTTRRTARRVRDAHKRQVDSLKRTVHPVFWHRNLITSQIRREEDEEADEEDRQKKKQMEEEEKVEEDADGVEKKMDRSQELKLVGAVCCASSLTHTKKKCKI